MHREKIDKMELKRVRGNVGSVGNKSSYNVKPYTTTS